MSSTSSVAIWRCSRPFIWIRFSVAISEITRSTCGISISAEAVATAAGSSLAMHSVRSSAISASDVTSFDFSAAASTGASTGRGGGGAAGASDGEGRRPKIGGATCIVRSSLRSAAPEQAEAATPRGCCGRQPRRRSNHRAGG